VFPILTVLVVAAQSVYYEAKVSTFGCFSVAEVQELQRVRDDAKAFQMALLTKQMQGQCIGIVKGTLVEGVVAGRNKSILRVNGKIDPPGYEAPLDDFTVKEMPAKDTTKPDPS
jgi:hypothetical protein